VPAAAFTAILTADTLQAAVPFAMAQSVAGTALGSSAIPATVLALAHEVIRSMTLLKLKFLGAIAVSLSLVGGGYGLVAGQGEGKQTKPVQAEGKKAKPSEPQRKPMAEGKKPEPIFGFTPRRITSIDLAGHFMEVKTDDLATAYYAVDKDTKVFIDNMKAD